LLTGQEIKKHLKGVSAAPGSAAIAKKIRSAQWMYWNSKKDQWLATGELLEYLAYGFRV
jgi:hypothetical protein